MGQGTSKTNENKIDDKHKNEILNDSIGDYSNVSSVNNESGFDELSDEQTSTANNSINDSTHPSDSLEFLNVSSNSEISKKVLVTFKYRIDVEGDVYLIGSFTNWKDKIQMTKSNESFVAKIELPEGEHQYKFLVDGKWLHDSSQEMVDDNFSGKNNIIIVK